MSESQAEFSLRDFTPELVKGLNVQEILPSLFKHKVLERKEYEHLQCEAISRRRKAEMIISLVSKKGLIAFNGLIKSLQETDNGTSHGKMAGKLLTLHR